MRAAWQGASWQSDGYAGMDGAPNAYLLVYRAHGGALEVLHVWHEAQDWAYHVSDEAIRGGVTFTAGRLRAC